VEEVKSQDLEEFESPVSTKPMKPLVWSQEKFEVAQLLATKGMTIDRVSEITCVPVTAIKRWKTHPEFSAYITKCILDIGDSLKAYRISCLLKTIDARVEKVEQLGDWSLFSSKDSLDILDAIRKETEKNEEKEQTQYMKTIEALIVKSAEAATQKQIESKHNE
jgi:hypothetical protein